MNTSYRENRRTPASGYLLFDIEEHSMDRRTLLSDDGGASVAGTAHVGGDRTSATRVRAPTPTLGEFKRRRNSYDNNDAAWIVANAHQKEKDGKAKASQNNIK
jgi:hypothetical protein